MIIAKIYGGLGNQMFQYATARALSEKLKQNLYLDESTFKVSIPNVTQRTFELYLFPKLQVQFIDPNETKEFYQPTRLNNKIRNFLGLHKIKIFRENSHSYNKEVEVLQPPVLLDGYFQSEKYFAEFKQLIMNLFEFPMLNSTDQNISVLNDIKNSISVSVHVRRGDYVRFAPTNSFHGTCSNEYYLNSIKYFQSHNSNCTFYFFSDEPEWIIRNLFQNGLNGKVVNLNKGTDSWKDMFLMSQCHHNIIANSSFSWWAAWLNKNDSKKVIAPSKWFKTNDPFYEPNNIVPEGWIKMF